MNGTWTSDASGIQWAFDGIGRTGFGRDRAADLGEDPDEVDVEAVARGERSGDVDVVERVGVGRVREQCAIEHQPDDEGEQVQERGGSARPVQRSTGSASADRYERPNRQDPGRGESGSGQPRY